ncbi:hypothetical protein DDP54_04240 [Cellulomonas sp. WB94]|nr:hypothetical protein DDP54_04240 [Cellulomonas sp. WB94]
MAAAVALTGIVALGGCAGGTGNPTGGASTPRYEVAPSGGTVTIEPTSGLDGSAEYETDVFSIEVPSGMTATKTDRGAAGMSVDLRADGAARASVIVNVTPQKGANDDAVNAASVVAAAQLGGSGLATDIVRSAATWEGFAYAVQMTFTLNLDANGTAQVLDGILVTTRNEARTYLVSISAEAPAGGLTSSVAYDALRTLRLKG